MKLKALLQDVETKSVYTVNPDITNVSDNTDKIRQNGLFVCVRGAKTDGHLFARKALERGAAVIICDHDIGISNSVIVEDTRKAYALISARFYGSCHRKMKIIGVTGTNGKTTVSYLIRKILEDSGCKTGLIGTVNVIIGKEKYPADLTTPDPVDLHRYLMLMHIAGCQACVMEVSSQALCQDRVYGINFECSVFTNLTAEHLDYHNTMQDYAKAKQLLFESSKISVINADDAYASQMLEAACGEKLTYSTSDFSDYSASDIRLTRSGVTYKLKTKKSEYNVSYDCIGVFSVYNSMAAIAVADAIGANTDKAVRSVARFDGIIGRMERVENSFGINIIIDYAHTPDSLMNALTTLRALYDGRLITVFGCGGDRDKSKRPEMGRVATRFSDFVFVTSDNPRNENPESIINDIVNGIPKEKYFRITDRKLAIKSALYSARAGDTVLIAGKGHEKYQILGTQKIYFNEREIIKKLLEDKARF
ncbi:MAG: UDP-N-acetylmuramoyl-L-alanyl-D-glutamate--2,6-diaminopimelate ligase [Clostridia bacterium]|nr:UDP-N-acetylmuramoyl-L-alanyl-D-glutamate--2,6-diaminopimelate ligase [Clostridia bacterium]